MNDTAQRLASTPEPLPAPLVRVVLVDTRPERLRVTRMLLERSGLVAVVGEADSQHGAIDEVGRSSADLVIVEIQMPVDEGLATIAALRHRFPEVRIVVCSFEQNAGTRRLATENGSDAYLGKPIDLGRFGDLLRLYATTRREPTDEGVVTGGSHPVGAG